MNIQSRGFTLIEAMIVVVILGILAAIAYPSYRDSVRKTRRAEARAALMQLMQQQERFFSQKASYSPFSSQSTDANEKMFKWFSAETAANSAYEISATACQDDVIQNCVLLTAEPGTSKVNPVMKGDACKSLTLTSTGVRGPAEPAFCWQ